MITRVSCSGCLIYALAALGLVAAAYAVPIRIATGPTSTVDGYLDVAPDEYGSWQSFTATTTNDDHFNPTGTPALRRVAFSDGFFLFGPNNERELLSDSTDWQAVNDGMSPPGPSIGSDTSLERMVTAANVASDTDGDTVNDMLTSSFRVFSLTTDTDLSFDLTQQVISIGPGVAVIVQDYDITNNGTQDISFDLLRAVDPDMVWTLDFSNDEVGTTTNSSTADRFVFQQEPGNPATAVALSSPQGGIYYGGKHGITPPNGPPRYDFGTDTEQWEAFGVPTSWENHIAGVGYNTDGMSGASPPGSTSPRDAFIGLNIAVSLASGASTSVRVQHTYGQNTPAALPGCPGDADGDGDTDLSDLGIVLSNFGCTGGGCPGDVDGDGDTDLSDLGIVLSNFGCV